VVLALSDAASYVNGAVLVADNAMEKSWAGVASDPWDRTGMREGADRFA
jgi:hypothetical protein